MKGTGCNYFSSLNAQFHSTNICACASTHACVLVKIGTNKDIK